MVKLLFYTPKTVIQSGEGLAGIHTFSYLFKIYNPRMSIVDRTGTISLPINIQSIFPLPHFRPFKKTYEEICNERARELLRRADEGDTKIYVFWSGGIDSTLALVSLLKNSTAVQRSKIVVLLSEESITEYPYFYREHIRGKLHMEPSAMFPYILGTKHIITSGELNDQVFGSNLSSLPFMKMFGRDIIYKPYQRDKLFQFYNAKTGDPKMTNFYLDLFDRLMNAAPIPIPSYFHYFWWLLFTLEWQGVYMRVLPFTTERNTKNISPHYFENNVAPFYGTEDFQLWSMNNLDKRIKNTWDTFKWPCKDIIYDYTKDVHYRDNKLKKASNSVWTQKGAYNFIDTGMQLLHDISPAEYYFPGNSFI